MSETENMTRTVCLVESVVSKYRFTSEVCTSVGFQNDNSYVRVSNYQEITFKPIPQEEIVLEKVKGIDQNIDILFMKIEEFRQQKQELLSITFQKKSNAD